MSDTVKDTGWMRNEPPILGDWVMIDEIRKVPDGKHVDWFELVGSKKLWVPVAQSQVAGYSKVRGDRDGVRRLQVYLARNATRWLKRNPHIAFRARTAQRMDPTPGVAVWFESTNGVSR